MIAIKIDVLVCYKTLKLVMRHRLIDVMNVHYQVEDT